MQNNPNAPSSNYNNPTGPNTIPQNNYPNNDSNQNNLAQQPNSADANGYGAKYDNKSSNYVYKVRQQPQDESDCCGCCLERMCFRGDCFTNSISCIDCMCCLCKMVM